MHTDKNPGPTFSALSEAESWALLSRNHVGRLCFSNRGFVDVEPVHYVVGEGWIFLRSARGTKLEAVAHNPHVAFEVDEIKDTFDWRSVVARGTVYVTPADGSRIERQAFERAVAALRSLVPETLTAGDPTPFRTCVYGIHVDAINGRMAEPTGRATNRHAIHYSQGGTPEARPTDGF